MRWNLIANPKRLAILIGVVMAAALAGCMVGPNYQAPKSTIAADWPAEAQVQAAAVASTQVSVAASQPADLARWWASFNDLELNSLVDRAMAANLDLKQAEARLLQARAQRNGAAAVFWPTVDAVGSYRRSESPSAGHSVSSDLYQAGFDAAWELDFFGGTRRNIEAGDASILAAVESRRDVLVTLLGEVATDYISLRGFQRELAIADENLTAQQHTADVTRKRFQGGFIGRLDVANSDAQVSNTRSQIPSLQTSAQQEIYAIAVLLGQDPASLDKELSTPGSIPPTPPVVPIGLPSELLQRRPDVRTAEAKLHAATAQIGVATAALFPKFSLTGNIGLQGNKPISLSNWSNHFWSVGPSVDWQIFNAGQVVANIQVQNALQQQALLTYKASVLTALSETYSALVAYNNEQQRRADLQQSVADNRQAVDLSTRLYQQGQTDFLNVLVAEQSLYGSQTALAQSQTNVSNDLVALYKALGGGWEERPASKPLAASQ